MDKSIPPINDHLLLNNSPNSLSNTMSPKLVQIRKPLKLNLIAIISIPILILLLTIGFITSQKTTENRSRAAHPGITPPVETKSPDIPERSYKPYYEHNPIIEKSPNIPIESYHPYDVQNPDDINYLTNEVNVLSDYLGSNKPKIIYIVDNVEDHLNLINVFIGNILYPGSFVGGLYRTDTDEIIIKRSGISGGSNIAHEIAHALINHDKNILKSWIDSPWITSFDPIGTGSIISWVNDTSPTKYGQTSPEEDFAESFRLYTQFPEALKENNILRYNFLKEKVFNNVEGSLIRDAIEDGRIIRFNLNNIFYSFKPRSVFAVFEEKPINLNKILSLHPGKSTVNDLVSLLGSPYKEYKGSDREVYWYSSEDGIHYHTFIFKNNILYLMTIHTYENPTENIKDYEQPEKVTFNYYREDTVSFIYPSKGNNFIVDLSGNIVVKQSFIPTTLDKFMAEWGKEFPEQSPLLLTTENLLTITPTHTPVPFDYQAFFNTLKNDFKKTGSPGFSIADFDNNGRIDIFDFNKYIQNSFSN